MKYQAKALRSSFGRIPKGSPLSTLAVNTVDEWFDAKHRKSCLDEDVLANSLSVQSCPCRGSQDIIRNGKRKDGIQTYLCLRCGHKFNPLSGTPFDSHKIPVSEWTEFLIHLFQHQSVLCSSLDNRNPTIQADIGLGRHFWSWRAVPGPSLSVLQPDLPSHLPGLPVHLLRSLRVGEDPTNPLSEEGRVRASGEVP